MFRLTRTAEKILEHFATADSFTIAEAKLQTQASDRATRINVQALVRAGRIVLIVRGGGFAKQSHYRVVKATTAMKAS